MEKFIGFNTIEVKKGEDLFNMDKAMLWCELFESFGPKLLPIFTPYVLKFTASNEECQQRCSSEMVFGLIKGIVFLTVGWMPVSSRNYFSIMSVRSFSSSLLVTCKDF